MSIMNIMEDERDIDFLYEVGCFRFIERTWKHVFHANLENNAEHVFRVAWIALALARHEGIVDHGKILKMVLVHDFGESRTGDVNYISRLYTKRDEARAITDIFQNTVFADEFPGLWEEYEKRETIEAKIVKDADNLDVDFEIAEQAAQGQKLTDTWIRHRKEGVYPKLYTKTARQFFEQIYETNPHHWHLAARNRFTAGDFKPNDKPE